MAVIIPTPQKKPGYDDHTIGRNLAPVEVDVILEQMHQSTLSITHNPVEFGADVTDHAYVEPKRLSMHIVTHQGTARAFATYNNLIALQEKRMPFSLVTGLKIYTNLLIEGITATRSHVTGQILDANVDMLEIIFSSGMNETAFKPVPGSPADRREKFGPRRGRQPLEKDEDIPDSLVRCLIHGCR